MALDDAERERLRAEEIYRAEVRRQLGGAATAPGLLERVSTFFESKVGFWLLTTVFAGVWATLFTGLTDWVRPERARAERARQDFETVMKIVPLLTSDQATQRMMGLSLLNGLASANSILPETAAQITATLQSIVATGTAPNASAEARAQAEDLARLVDATGATTASRPGAATGTRAAAPAAPLAAAISAVALPARVYVQIGSPAQRADAERAVDALRAAGMLAPGIELVGAVPRRSQLRYCDDKVLDATRDTVRDVLVPIVPQLELQPLLASQCRNVRPNNFELWFGSGGG